VVSAEAPPTPHEKYGASLVRGASPHIEGALSMETIKVVVAIMVDADARYAIGHDADEAASRFELDNGVPSPPVTIYLSEQSVVVPTPRRISGRLVVSGDQRVPTHAPRSQKRLPAPNGSQ
jgi:hypothetical protein